MWVPSVPQKRGFGNKKIETGKHKETNETQRRAEKQQLDKPAPLVQGYQGTTTRSRGGRGLDLVAELHLVGLRLLDVGPELLAARLAVGDRALRTKAAGSAGPGPRGRSAESAAAAQPGVARPVCSPSVRSGGAAPPSTRRACFSSVVSSQNCLKAENATWRRELTLSLEARQGARASRREQCGALCPALPERVRRLNTSGLA